ncbi:DNA-3-methyladenine glycosylase family protein [Pseudothauera rhizosphaerae]|uniref:DNA-3-methyladenine glycosylase II n=1 Tax=Pseudothauera rhizosphaerae TaxID=2565932 RepID=A0A4S4AU29_9RHOO|nr:AlkA N-terminal domain-containing protein [Pseudothauera rhizosphaerae]THF62095.1 DNA-3-methyladenine glycosylase 2 family protein [Pseudothauera rhizosphaerae]
MSEAAEGLACRIPLPADYRAADLLALHRRDPHETAERVDDRGFAKGIVWQGRPACLQVRLTPSRAEARLAVDGGAGPASDELARLVRHMLGLTQPVEDFEHRHRRHPQLGTLIAARPGLRVPQAASPFEALSWAVTGQQISVRAAVAVRGRLIRAVGVRHSGGLYCYPDAAHLAATPEPALRAAGLSGSKAATLLALAAEVAEGRLPLDDWRDAPQPDEIRTRLRQIRGIGPWTVDYALLRGFAWLDGSLHGDVALRRGLQRLLGSTVPPVEREAEQWLRSFSPWRSLVAVHLWALQADRDGAGGQN